MASKKQYEIPLRLPVLKKSIAFGQWAAERRRALGLTQPEAAERYLEIAREMGYTEDLRKRDNPWFSNLENAKVQIQTDEELQILARLYRVPVLELLAHMGYESAADISANHDPDITDLHTLVEDMDKWEKDTILNLYRRHMDRVQRQTQASPKR